MFVNIKMLGLVRTSQTRVPQRQGYLSTIASPPILSCLPLVHISLPPYLPSPWRIGWQRRSRRAAGRAGAALLQRARRHAEATRQWRCSSELPGGRRARRRCEVGGAPRAARHPPRYCCWQLSPSLPSTLVYPTSSSSWPHPLPQPPSGGGAGG